MRKPSTSCISEINIHLFEGPYSPIWIDSKKRSLKVCAHIRAECEGNLEVLINELKTEVFRIIRAALVCPLLAQALRRNLYAAIEPMSKNCKSY